MREARRRQIGGADDGEARRPGALVATPVVKRPDDGFVEEGLTAIGGHADGSAQGLGGDAQDAAAGAEEHLHRLTGEDLLRGAGGLEAVLDGRAERLAVERLHVELDSDARAEGGVLLHVKSAREVRQADEPEGDEIAAVEGEVEKAREVEQEHVGEVLGLVENDDGRGAALVDHVHEGLLEIGPELAAPMRGPDAELVGE
jgi:hypothetical protein